MVIVSSPSFVSMIVFIVDISASKSGSIMLFASIFPVIFILSSLSMILPSASPDVIAALFVVTLRVTPSL